MLKDIQEFAKKYGIWAALFISLLIFMLNGYERRETSLMNFLGKQSEINAKVSNTLERIDIRLQNLECNK